MQNAIDAAVAAMVNASNKDEFTRAYASLLKAVPSEFPPGSVDADYVQQVSEVLFDILWVSPRNARKPSLVKRQLGAEANRFRDLIGWRSTNKALAIYFQRLFETLAFVAPAAKPGNKRGAARSQERVYVDQLVDLWDATARAHGRHDLIGRMLKPGFKPDDRSSTPGIPSVERESLMGMVLSLAEKRGQTVSRQRVKIAIRSRAKISHV